MYILLISILVFVLCYISNFSFGLYYNTKVLYEKISKTKLKNTAQKLKYDERYIGIYDYYGTDKNHFSEDGHERLSYIIEQKIRANFYK